MVRAPSSKFSGSVYQIGGRWLSSSSPSPDQEWLEAKPFSEIPGPKPLPIPKFGNFWRFLPGIGPYANMGLAETQRALFAEFGPIVRFGGVGSTDVIMINDPDSIQQVFRTEGQWPIRRSLDSMTYYRNVVRKDVFSGFKGVLTTEGEEWQRNRSIVNQPMMKPQNLKSYHRPNNGVAAEFVERMKQIRDTKNELPKDFHNELNKWALESIALAALDKRLGCFDPDLKEDSDAQIVISSLIEMFELFFKLDAQPSLWRIVSTRNYRKFVRSCDRVLSIYLKNINQKIEEIKARPKSDSTGLSVLESFLKMENGQSVAINMALDMMTAGVDTTANTMSFAIYYLATNPEAQEKLYNELKDVMPSKRDYLPEGFGENNSYLKSCLKESQRLAPVTIVNLRGAGKDIVLKGYQIPKGTDILMANLVMCHKDEYFPNAKKFVPERWLKTKEGVAPSKSINPFVYLPFGYGPRMCIGRRFAELEMRALLSQIFRNFRVSFDYGELETQTTLLLSPKTPLKFNIEDRPT